MSGGERSLNGFLICLSQGDALAFVIFGFHRIAARSILSDGQNKSDQLLRLIAFTLLIICIGSCVRNHAIKNCFFDNPNAIIKVLLYVSAPEVYDSPPKKLKLQIILMITFHVFLDFCDPVLRVIALL